MDRNCSGPPNTLRKGCFMLVHISLQCLPVLSPFWTWRKLPSYVPYKGTYVPYEGTFGAPDQGQMLDVWESQTTGSALRWLAPHHSISYSLSCSWSYSWSYSWTHVLGTKTMTSLILDPVARDHLYLGINTGEKDMFLELSRDKIMIVFDFL